MNMNEIMRQAQQMQRKIERVREEAGNRTSEGSAGGGMITVVANGKNEIVAVRIDRAVVDPNELEMLQDLFVAAANQALQRANEVEKEHLSKLTNGMPIPGLF